jgi:hypothetical protein
MWTVFLVFNRTTISHSKLLNDFLSFEVLSGVPKSSCLEALLFNLIGLCNLIKHSMHLHFSDDIKVFHGFKSLNGCILLQSDINFIRLCCAVNCRNSTLVKQESGVGIPLCYLHWHRQKQLLLVNKTQYITSVIGIFNWRYPSGRAIALGSTQPPISVRGWVPGIFLGVKGGRCVGLKTLPSSYADCH